MKHIIYGMVPHSSRTVPTIFVVGHPCHITDLIGGCVISSLSMPSHCLTIFRRRNMGYPVLREVSEQLSWKLFRITATFTHFSSQPRNEHQSRWSMQSAHGKLRRREAWTWFSPPPWAGAPARRAGRSRPRLPASGRPAQPDSHSDPRIVPK